MKDNSNNTALFRARYGIFETMSILTEENNHKAKRVIGFSYKDEDTVYKEGFNLIYGFGDKEKVDIVGAPFGIYDAPNFAITKKLNNDGTKDIVFLFFD